MASIINGFLVAAIVIVGLVAYRRGETDGFEDGFDEGFIEGKDEGRGEGLRWGYYQGAMDAVQVVYEETARPYPTFRG
jgi:hypothetical protein